MRRNRKTNTEHDKKIARIKYAERKIDEWWKWSFRMRGKVLYKELIEVQNKYGVKDG